MTLEIDDYLKRTLKRVDLSIAEVEGFFKFVEMAITDKLYQIHKVSKAGGVLKLKELEAIYKAENWERIMSLIDMEKSTVNSRLLKLLGQEAADLKALYGYQLGKENLYSTIRPLIQGINNYTASVEPLRKVLLSEHKALYYSVVASNITPDFESIRSQLAQKLRPSLNITTEFRTASARIYQQMRNDVFKAVAGSKDTYTYMGVVDSKNREICRRYVGVSKTKKEWQSLDNGQGGNIWDNLGGFNCRHMILLDVKDVEVEE